MSALRLAVRPQGPAAVVALVAAAVAAVDLATKQLAVGLLGAGESAVGPFRLALTYNDQLAWGLTAGRAALPLTAVSTALLLLCVAVVCRPLAQIDRGAPRMLGLIVGAGAGNLLSGVAYAAGAPDFVRLEWGAASGWAFNVADVALFAGLALCGRTVLRLLVAVWREHSAPTASVVVEARVARAAEVEVPLRVYDEVAAVAAVAAAGASRRERGVGGRDPGILPADVGARRGD